MGDLSDEYVQSLRPDGICWARDEAKDAVCVLMDGHGGRCFDIPEVTSEEDVEGLMDAMKSFVVVHNLRDPNDSQGRSYRDVNLANLAHDIPIGTLVELEDGVRLWVVCHGRDCDGTPLYSLCPNREDTTQHDLKFENFNWFGGYPESSMMIVEAKS